MSSIREGLFPDKLLLVVQGGVYLAGLAVAHFLIVKPALRLQLERMKRTRGKRDKAAGLVVDGDSLSKKYEARFREVMDEARRLRAAELSRGQREAQQLVVTSQEQVRLRIQQARSEVETDLRTERQRLPAMVDGVVNSIFAKLGIPLFLSAFLASVGFETRAGAAGDTATPVTMDSFVWPYFQFTLFALVVFFAGKKVLPGILASRRENLRRELTEAQGMLEASQKRVTELERQVAQIETDMSKIQQQYKADGEREAAALVAEAKHSAEQMVKDAESVVREAVAQGRESLRRELLDLAISAVQTRLNTDRLNALDESLRKDALGGVGQIAKTRGDART
jgi:F0F1-type ATP synthase membrane subunit b/b'